MAIDRRTVEGIEACRPGSDDLLSPEMDDVARQVQRDPAAAAHYRHVQVWDAAIADAMESPPVPADLAARILQRLAENKINAPVLGASISEATREIGVGPKVVEPSATAPLAESARWSRRAWLGIPTAIAATVLVALTLGRLLPLGEETPVETLADRWLAGLTTTWQVTDPAPEGFDIPAVITAQSTGWQRIGQLGGTRGVAYKLVHETEGTAELLVMRLDRNAPTTPPSSPQSTTGGRSIGYWRSGSLLYVLVVNGDERNYRAFVNSSSRPLA